VSSRLTRGGGALGILLAVGCALDPLEPRGTAEEEGDPAVVAWATLGPTAELAADAAWLRLNLAWEARQAAEVRAWIRVTLAAAPRFDYFRLNAARMLAYDLPAWRAAAEPDAPAAVRARWGIAAAEEAEACLAFDSSASPTRWIEDANLALHARGDRALAAERYRRAAELPGAPWHAGRIYAQLLRELGRDGAALAWLRTWAPRLPPDDPSAQRELVMARIAELELELRSRGEPL
jgi:hypothetical protein